MEQAKEYLWKSIVEDLERSTNEKVKNNLKAFKSKEDLIKYVQFYSSLLYTSDAADDTPCVYLGGRRIIKKKKK